MTEKTTWICDGCDAELVRRFELGTDWKIGAVQLVGFTGYPTNAEKDPVYIHFHLCPACARRYYRDAHPRNWTRADNPAKPQGEQTNG